MGEKYKQALEKIAAMIPKKPSHLEDEDFSPSDWSGGNFDDAYSLGVDAGLWYAAEEAAAALEKEG